MTKQWADWLVSDLELAYRIESDLRAESEGLAEIRRATIHHAKADAYAKAIALVTMALPKIIEEARFAERFPTPDRAAVFAPLEGAAS